MLKQKKTFLIIFVPIIIFLILIKFIDTFFQKKYGLGNPIIYENSRIYGYKIKANQNIKRKGNKIIINNLGMRSNKSWEENLIKKKILFFGDSVTYGGSIVSNNDLFSEKICKQLNKDIDNYICGNLGANGYSLHSIIRRIKYKEFDNEDLIIVTIISNNFPRIFHNSISQPFWTKKISNFYPALTEIFFIYLDKLRNKAKYNLGSEDVFENINLQYYNDLTNELEEVLNKNNKPYIIFYSPSLNELEKIRDNYFKNILKDKFKNFYDLGDIQYIEKKNLYYDNIHLNKKGHDEYSKFILSIIKEKYLNKI